MKTKYPSLFLAAILLLTTIIPETPAASHIFAVTKASTPCTASSQSSVNRPLVEKSIARVENSNDDITYYILSIFDNDLTPEEKENLTKNIQNKIRILEADIIDTNRSIKIDDYDCQTCQLLTTLSISLQHNKNAMNEMLIYLNATSGIERLESLDRFFFSKNASYENLNQVKRTLDILR